MKKCLFYIFLISLVLPQSEKLAISILDFNGEDVSPKVLKACFQRLETSLIESDNFIVIEKSEREEILNEQKIQSSGICDTDCIVDIGQLLGAEYLMLGEIIDLSGLYQIDIKIINVEKGDITEKVTEEVEGKVKDLLNAMESASNEIIRRLSIQTPNISQTPFNIMQEVAIQQYGVINITTEPINAIVLIDNEKIGTTPIKGKKVKVGKKNLKIIKSGYNTINKGIRISEADTVTLNELLTYKTGVLELSSNPQGANIYINSNLYGKAPIKVEELIVGKYEIRVSLLDYFDGLESVIVEYAKTTKLKINLTPKPGTLNFVLNVGGVEIYVNEKKYRSDQSGFTTINKLIPGDYDIKLVKAGYKSMARKLKVFPNKSQSIEVEMYIDKNIKVPSASNTLTIEEANILNIYKSKSELNQFHSKRSAWIYAYYGRRIGDDHVLIDTKGVQVKELPDGSSKTLGTIAEGTKLKILSVNKRYLEIQVSDRLLQDWDPNYKLPDYKKTSKKSKTKNIKKDSKTSPINLGFYYLIYLLILGLTPAS